MRLAKSSAVVLLTFLWVLAVNHCALEQLVDLKLLSCTARQGAYPDQEKGCEGDGCESVENQLYKVEDAQVPLAAPTFEFSACLSPLWAETPILRNWIQLPPTPAPPGFSCHWQFSHRTALPPRAPSLLS